MWIDPETDHLITGDDGGSGIPTTPVHTGGRPTTCPSQFYHVSLDMDRPYHVYGGLQDNSSWVGDSQYPGGITNSRWENMRRRRLLDVRDPSDPTCIYAEAQAIGRVNRKTHETRNIKPLPLYKEGKLRYSWNADSPQPDGQGHHLSRLPYCSPRDHGQTWSRISPDLTTNDPQTEAGAVRRGDGRQLIRRDAHDDLRHLESPLDRSSSGSGPTTATCR